MTIPRNLPATSRGVGASMRWVLCALFLSHASLAGATTDEERAGARAAANAGAEAFESQRWADAITYFEKAESLVHAPPHLLHIARAHEKLGHLVEAREAYLKVTREALPADAPKVFRQAVEQANSELDALEPRVPRVSVVVQGDSSTPIKVLMNGKPVPDGLVGVPRPMNPGDYEFQASAEGAESSPVRLTVREGTNETVVLTLTRSASSTAPAPGPAQPASETLTQDTGDSETRPSTLRIASYASLGVGVVGVGLGTIFALRSTSKRNEANDICSLEGEFSCPENRRDEVEQLDSDADSAKTMSIVGFIVGGAGIAAGVTLYLMSDEDTGQAASITPWAGLGSVGVRGRF